MRPKVEGGNEDSDSERVNTGQRVEVERVDYTAFWLAKILTRRWRAPMLIIDAQISCKPVYRYYVLVT